jgi:hypothetical protein
MSVKVRLEAVRLAFGAMYACRYASCGEPLP